MCNIHRLLCSVIVAFVTGVIILISRGYILVSRADHRNDVSRRRRNHFPHPLSNQSCILGRGRSFVVLICFVQLRTHTDGALSVKDFFPPPRLAEIHHRSHLDHLKQRRINTWRSGLYIRKATLPACLLLLLFTDGQESTTTPPLLLWWWVARDHQRGSESGKRAHDSLTTAQPGDGAPGKED